MVSLACAEKPPPSLKANISDGKMRTNLFQTKHFFSYKLKQINFVIMFIFIKIYNIIGIRK